MTGIEIFFLGLALFCIGFLAGGVWLTSYTVETIDETGIIRFGGKYYKCTEIEK